MREKHKWPTVQLLAVMSSRERKEKGEKQEKSKSSKPDERNKREMKMPPVLQGYTTDFLLLALILLRVRK